MTTSISSNGLPKFPQPASSTGNGVASKPADAGVTVNTAPKTGDQLKLTDSALALQEAARQDGSSTIDASRVERIRQSLADGSYRIDAGRIADRMIAMERQIEGTGKA